MPRFRPVPTRWIAAMAMTLLAGACDLPRPGPNAEEIVAGSKTQGGTVNIVMVTEEVAHRARLSPDRGFASTLVSAGRTRTDRISAGDTLSVTVWENVDNGLLVGTGQKVAVLNEIQVDQNGDIFMPYAGRVRAEGLTPDQLRLEITDALGTQTPDPQVEVRRAPGDGASVNIIGGVANQGVYPIEASTSRLAAMLANAGGATVDPEIALVTVRRGGQSDSVYLQDLYDRPALDIALRAGDTIIVEVDRRAFTALGATGTQARVPFPRAEIDVIDALAEVGGLDGSVSDPTGIFVFRRESQSVARQVTGNQAMGPNEPFAYVIDLTKPSGFFIAKEFQMRDDDTIYITEAPFTAWARILDATSSSLVFATSVVRLVDDN